MTDSTHDRLDLIAHWHRQSADVPLCLECLLPWPCRSWRATVLPVREERPPWQPDKQTP